MRYLSLDKKSIHINIIQKRYHYVIVCRFFHTRFFCSIQIMKKTMSFCMPNFVMRGYLCTFDILKEK